MNEHPQSDEFLQIKDKYDSFHNKMHEFKIEEGSPVKTTLKKVATVKNMTSISVNFECRLIFLATMKSLLIKNSKEKFSCWSQRIMSCSEITKRLQNNIQLVNLGFALNFEKGFLKYCSRVVS